MIFRSGHGFNAGTHSEIPLRDVLQRWRICLASLLFFTLLIVDGVGFTLKLHSSPRIIREIFFNSSARAGSRRDQCLILSRELSKDICTRFQLDRRKAEIRNNVHFKFCYTHSASIYSVVNSPSQNCIVDETLQQCKACLHRLEDLDNQAMDKFMAFQDLIDRFDCNDSFSSVGNCQKCKEAYKNWLCALSIPYYLSNIEVLPCKDICLQVEKACPFFRPLMLETHAGDPSFICKDPQILGTNDGIYGKSPRCYQMCHVDLCQAETTDQCPDIDLSVNSTIATSACNGRHYHPPLLHSIAQYGFLWWLVWTMCLYLSSGLT